MAVEDSISLVEMLWRYEYVYIHVALQGFIPDKIWGRDPEGAMHIILYVSVCELRPLLDFVDCLSILPTSTFWSQLATCKTAEGHY